MTDWAPTMGLSETYAAVDKLGLLPYVAELDAKGYTIIPPELVAPLSQTDELLKAVLRTAEQRTGVAPDVEGGTSHVNIRRPRAAIGDTGQQDWLWHLLFEDRVFEQALMNPTVVALVDYLLGAHSKLSSDGAIIKGPSDGASGRGYVHCDNYGIPAPFPSYSQVCNVTWALTDYTLEGGATGFVPASHRLGRHPLNFQEGLDHWVPAESPRGGLIVWLGATWHTLANPRTIPGLRVNYVMLFCRQYIVPQQLYQDVAPAEVLERNPERFATFMGLHDPYGVHGSIEDYHRNLIPDRVSRGAKGNSQFE